MAVMAVVSSSHIIFQCLYGATGGTDATTLSAPVALKALLDATAYHLVRVFLSDSEKDSEEELIEAINNTKLDVKVEETGDISTTVKVADRLQTALLGPRRDIKPVSVKDSNGAITIKKRIITSRSLPTS